MPQVSLLTVAPAVAVHLLQGQPFSDPRAGEEAQRASRIPLLELPGGGIVLCNTGPGLTPPSADLLGQSLAERGLDRNDVRAVVFSSIEPRHMGDLLQRDRRSTSPLRYPYAQLIFPQMGWERLQAGDRSLLQGTGRVWLVDRQGRLHRPEGDADVESETGLPEALSSSLSFFFDEGSLGRMFPIVSTEAGPLFVGGDLLPRAFWEHPPEPVKTMLKGGLLVHFAHHPSLAGFLLRLEGEPKDGGRAHYEVVRPLTDQLLLPSASHVRSIPSRAVSGTETAWIEPLQGGRPLQQDVIRAERFDLAPQRLKALLPVLRQRGFRIRSAQVVADGNGGWGDVVAQRAVATFLERVRDDASDPIVPAGENPSERFEALMKDLMREVDRVCCEIFERDQVVLLHVLIDAIKKGDTTEPYSVLVEELVGLLKGEENHGLLDLGRLYSVLARYGEVVGSHHFKDLIRRITSGATFLAALDVDEWREGEWRRRVYLVHIGDCRAYKLSAGGLTRLTRDHVWFPGDPGVIMGSGGVPRKFRLIPARVLGHPIPKREGLSADPEVLPVDVITGDRIVIASDGLKGWETRVLRRLQSGDPAEGLREVYEMLKRQSLDDNLAIAVHVLS